MAYVTDGSSHRNGTINEDVVVDFLNNIGIFSSTICKLGGTKCKADAACNDAGISIKRKANIRTGSFDWLNTSVIPSYITEQFTEFFDTIAKYRNELTPDERELLVDEVRQNFQDLATSILLEMPSEVVTGFLKNALIERYEKTDSLPCKYIAITDARSKKLYLYPHNQHPVIIRLQSDDEFDLVRGTGRKATSVQVAGTGLRIRLTTNNGIRPLLGIGKSNNQSASLVLKLQQDGVNALLNDVNPLVFDMEAN